MGGMGVQGPRCGGARRRVSTGREMEHVPGLGPLEDVACLSVGPESV